MSHLRPWKVVAIVGAFSLVASLSSFADRPGVDDHAPHIALRGNVPPAANAANDVGRADPARILPRVSLYFKRTPAQQSDLNQLLAALQDKRSPQYHQWLTPEQSGERFGASPEQIQATAQWLQSQGLSITEIARSRNHIRFGGTVAQVEAALHTQMHRYQLGSELHISNSSEPEVPAALADSILGFRNLHDFRPHPHNVRRVRPHFTSSISGNTFLVPDDFASIYDLKPFYDAGFTGGGRKIAVVGQTSINLPDIRAFRSAAGLPANDPQPVYTPGTCAGVVANNQCPDVSTMTGDIDESNLDLEWSGAIARDATIMYVYAGNNGGAFDALEYAINNNIAPVISVSYGDCEANVSQSEMATLTMDLDNAATHGQTVVSAAGDSGATDCDYTMPHMPPVISATHGLAVDFPAAYPSVTGVGGTHFSADVNHTSSFWGTTNDANSGSALLFITEDVWNDSDSNGLSSGGGGISSTFPLPAWQTPLPNLDGSHRYVPDVAFSASPGHDGYLICSQGSCVNGFRDGNQNLDPIGGTSAGAPSFAAALTLLEQSLGTDPSHGLGNINPSIYQAAANPAQYANSFHDTLTGNNMSACTVGTTGCPNGGSIGYSAGSGYDLASGLGSVDAFNLAGALSGKATSITTVAVDNSSPLLGANVNATATVTGNPSGNVIFYVDGVATGSPTPLGNSTAQTSVSFATAGVHTIGAAYMGSGSVAGSSALAKPAVVTAQSPTATFSLAASPTSLALSVAGNSQTSQITASTANAYSGTVNFTCAVSFLGNLTPANLPKCSFSPTSVTFAANTTSASTTLTVSSFATTAMLSPHNNGLRWAEVSTAALAFFVLLAPGDRKRRYIRATLFALSIALCGCGGGSHSSNNQGGGSSVPVSTGSYQVTVTGTGTDGATSSVNVIVAVQ